MKSSRFIKMGLGVLAFIAFHYGIWLWFSIHTRNRVLQDELRPQLSSNTDLYAEVFQSMAADQSNSLEFLSKVPPIQGIIRAKANGGFDEQGNSDLETWKARLTVIFSNFMEANEELFQIRYLEFGNGGQELVKVIKKDNQIFPVPTEALQQKGSRYYIQEMSQLDADQIYFSKFDLNREQGELEIPYIPTLRIGIVVPNDETSNRFGCVLFNIDLRFTEQRLKEKLDANELHFVTDEQANFIIHTNPSRAFALAKSGRHYTFADAFSPNENGLMQSEFGEVLVENKSLVSWRKTISKNASAPLG